MRRQLQKVRKYHELKNGYIAETLGVVLPKSKGDRRTALMQKELDERGKPLYSADGKVLKSALFSPPNLRALIEQYSGKCEWKR